ncbi:Transcription factor bHLH113-like protein [Drosera capensis]
MEAHDHDHDESVGFDDLFISGDGFSKLLFDLEGGGDFYSALPPSSLPVFSGEKMVCGIGNEMGLCEVHRSSTFGYAAVMLESPQPWSVAGGEDPGQAGKGINKKKRNASGQAATATANSGDGMIGAKNGEEGSVSSVKRAKARRRQRLGEGIVTLQQLVCPYDKTDAASVLHEAMGYIRFLQEQVKVLCFPYLQCQHPSPECRPCDDGGIQPGESRKGLRSKGLRLVPVDHITHISNSNGADLWSRSSTIMSINPTGSSQRSCG